ncbi:MAG: LAGLIDADG family homing endonuclease [Thermoprotei archaeon]|nr:LAGLIDADG family homing endonuclease [Thermoprotei archaeon]
MWETYEVVTKRGFRLRGTPNHPILTDEGWVSLRDLKPGQRVKLITRLPSPNHYIAIPNDEIMPVKRPYRGFGSRKIKERRKVKRVPILDERLAEVLGAFVAGGFFTGESIGFGLGIEEVEFENHIISRIKELFGIEPYRRTYRRSERTRVKKARSFRYDSIYLARLFKWLDHGHEEKIVPRWVLLSPKTVSAAFLRGLFEGDGTVEDRPRYTGVRLKSKSRKLLEGVQILLLRHGIISSIYESTSKDKRYKKTYKGYVLVIRGLDELKKFKEEIGFISRQKNEKLDRAIARRKRKSPRKEEWDIVKSVKRIHGWVRVYDFHIPETHSFFTNALLSHNTAKSALVRRAASLLNARFFKYLLTKYTEPSELFGPLDIRSLRKGVYARVTRGKLPEADIAFLDEVFNASSAVLNSLLSIMMERVVYDGYMEIKVPLWCVFGASNRVPEEPELEALYDRFLLRTHVEPLSQDYWSELLDASWKLETGALEGSGLILSMDDLKAIYSLSLKVDLSPVKPHLIRLFLVMEEKGLHITDRRKGKALKVVAAHALLNNRRVATEDDLVVLKYVVPKTLEDFDKVQVILMEELRTRERVQRELNEIKTNVKTAASKIQALSPFDPRLTDYYKNLKVARNKVLNLVKDYDDDEEIRKLAAELVNEIDDLLEIVMAKLNV